MLPTSQARSQHTQQLRRLGLDLIPGCELRVLAALMDTDDGWPPAIRDVCERLGLSSPSSVQPPLARLTEAGLVTREADKARTARACCVFVPVDELEDDDGC